MNFVYEVNHRGHMQGVDAAEQIFQQAEYAYKKASMWWNLITYD